MKKKNPTKVTINELRSIVKKILKEELGGGAPETLENLIATGKILYFPEIGGKYEKSQKKLINGRGKLVFNETLQYPNGIKFSTHPNVKDVHTKPIQKGCFLYGDFDKFGLISTASILAANPEAQGKDPFDKSVKKDVVVGYVNVRRSI